jgi:hypothetical protein
MAAGMSITLTPLTTLIMAAVPSNNAGIGSAMNDTTRELGGALGVAVLGSLVSTRYTAELGSFLVDLPAGQAAAADSGLAGALSVARDLPGTAGQALADAARSAYLDGLSLALLASAAICVAAAVVAYLLLPTAPVMPFELGPDEAPEPEPELEAA